MRLVGCRNQLSDAMHRALILQDALPQIQGTEFHAGIHVLVLLLHRDLGKGTTTHLVSSQKHKISQGVCKVPCINTPNFPCFVLKIMPMGG